MTRQVLHVLPWLYQRSHFEPELRKKKGQHQHEGSLTAQTPHLLSLLSCFIYKPSIWCRVSIFSCKNLHDGLNKIFGIQLKTAMWLLYIIYNCIHMFTKEIVNNMVSSIVLGAFIYSYFFSCRYTAHRSIEVWMTCSAGWKTSDFVVILNKETNNKTQSTSQHREQSACRTPASRSVGNVYRWHNGKTVVVVYGL